MKQQQETVLKRILKYSSEMFTTLICKIQCEYERFEIKIKINEVMVDFHTYKILTLD